MYTEMVANFAVMFGSSNIPALRCPPTAAGAAAPTAHTGGRRAVQ